MIEIFDCYKNLKILVTGHTGFKGSWLTLWLKCLGANVIGYSLLPNTEPAMFQELNLQKECVNIFGDIRDAAKLNEVFQKYKPDIVFHLAAQPLVRLSYFEPVQTYETNVIGTLNVLEAAKNCPSVRAFVNITTDKCYENKEINYAYKEDDKLGGYDMYSSSKACSEILTSSYRNSFLQNEQGERHFLLASARAGNVIGGGDWAMDRLVPDCIKSINKNKPIQIRNPHSVRPWQHVLEPLGGYLILGEKLLKADINSAQKFTQGFNFGPNSENSITVGEIAKKIIEYYGKGEIIFDERCDAENLLHEANLLMLDTEKANNVLDWYPVYCSDEAIKQTVEWYKRFYTSENMFEFTTNQIKQYMNAKTELNNESIPVSSI